MSEKRMISYNHENETYKRMPGKKFARQMQKEEKEMLSYKEFKEEIKSYMEQQMGNGYEVDICKVRKANIGLIDSMTVFEKGKAGDHVSPNIYLEPFYQKYKEGMEMQKISGAIMFEYQRGIENAEVFMDMIPDIRNYGTCKDRLYFKLVGTERNRTLLKKVPHHEVMDLSVVPYILLNESEDGTSSVMVSNTMAKSWGVSEEDVVKQAFDNMPRIMPAKASTMKSLVETVLGIAADNEDNEDIIEAASGMASSSEIFSGPFVLTNKRGMNGFAAVLYPRVLKDAADMIGKNLFILPSSVHESLLIADDGSVEASDLCKMVKEVNETCVAEDEVVSNSVYFYDREKGTLSMAEEGAVCVRL